MLTVNVSLLAYRITSTGLPMVFITELWLIDASDGIFSGKHTLSTTNFFEFQSHMCQVFGFFSVFNIAI
jgi:hypothetical protein